jgi:Arc/MetJ-type ribon-helix-helix transcriptional regulator
MADTEKITINLSATDLGRIDLLAEEGFYSNRTDFIRTAIRKELDSHDDVVQKSVVRREMVLGIVSHSRRTLERCLGKKVKLDIQVVGGLFLGKDVTPELALAAIKSVKVYGVLRASPAVKDALASRIQ